MLLLAGVFGGLSGATGAYVSYLSVQMPTGPWIVVAITVIFTFSLVFAGKRGIASRYRRYYRFRRKTAEENVLRTLYILGEQTANWTVGHTKGDILRFRNMSPGYLRHTLNRLVRKGFVTECGDDVYTLTEAGQQRAARITRVHRLWELYLTRKLELAPDHVHDDAEEIEHILTPDLEARLAAALDEPETDPHSKPIPTYYGLDLS
jgi:manganese/zinc/iron transport system permease protein